MFVEFTWIKRHLQAKILMDAVSLCNPLTPCLLCHGPLFQKHPSGTVQVGACSQLVLRTPSEASIMERGSLRK